MTSCFECNFEPGIIYCQGCDYNLCSGCNAQKHLFGQLGLAQGHDPRINSNSRTEIKLSKTQHKYFLVCEECEIKEREYFCSDCEEKFCDVCFETLHKRGKRRFHTKKFLTKFENYQIFLNIILFDTTSARINELQLLLNDYLNRYKLLIKYVIIITNDSQELYQRVEESRFFEIYQTKSDLFFSNEGDFAAELKENFPPCFYVNKIHIFTTNNYINFEKTLPSIYRNAKIARNTSMAFIEESFNQKFSGSNLPSQSRSNMLVTPDRSSSMNIKRDLGRSGSRKKNYSNTSSPQQAKLMNIGSIEIQVRKYSILSQNANNKTMGHETFAIPDESKLSILLEGKSHSSYNPGLNLKHPIFHIYNDIEFEDKTLKNYSLLIQQEFHNEALKGNLKFLYDAMLLKMQSKYEIPLPKLNTLCEKAVMSNIFYKQVREFSSNHKLIFISLKASFLFSHENFLWIIKSLHNDCISFTIPMIINRIKDIFDLALSPDYLYEYLDEYIKLKNSMDSTQESIFDNLDVYKEGKNNYKILFYLNGASVKREKILFEKCEDLEAVYEENEEFQAFLKFIDDTFEEDLITIDCSGKPERGPIHNNPINQDTNPLETPFYHKDSDCGTLLKKSHQEDISSQSNNAFLEHGLSMGQTASLSNTKRKLKPCKNAFNFTGSKPSEEYMNIKIAKDDEFEQTSKSKTNALQKGISGSNSRFCSSIDHNIIYSTIDAIKDPVYPNEKEMGNFVKKAIPGGKYGFALFVKHFGTQKLKKLSLGKILALIDKAVKIEYIKYIKTFIIKNENYVANKTPVNEEESRMRQQLLELFRDALEKIVKDSKGEVNFAQAKELLEQTTNRKFKDLEKYGISKLKAFIELYPDQFKLEESKKGTLTLKFKMSSNSKLIEKRNQNSNKKRPTKAKKESNHEHFPKAPVESLKDISYKRKFSVSQKKDRLNVSTIDGYLNKIKVVIFQILNNSKTGVELGQLQKLLNEKIVSEFDYVTFGYENFYNFLLENLSNFIEVEVRHFNKYDVRYIIYLKNKRFGVAQNDKYILPYSGLEHRDSRDFVVNQNNSTTNNASLNMFLNKLLVQNNINQPSNYKTKNTHNEKLGSNISLDFQNFSSNYLSKLRNSNLVSHEDRKLNSPNKKG